MKLFEEIIKSTLSPWTVFLLLIYLLNRQEIKALVRTLRDVLTDITEFKYGSVQITKAGLSDLIGRVRRLDQDSISDIVEKDDVKQVYDNVQKISKSIPESLNVEDMATFFRLFQNDDAIVTKHGSRYAITLKRLESEGLVHQRSELKAFSKIGSQRLSRWEITPEGRVIRHVFASKTEVLFEQPEA